MSKEALAQMLREYPTWGDAALAYKARAEALEERAKRLENPVCPSCGYGGHMDYPADQGSVDPHAAWKRDMRPGVKVMDADHRSEE